jgi:hypothetical protein
MPDDAVASIVEHIDEGRSSQANCGTRHQLPHLRNGESQALDTISIFHTQSYRLYDLCNCAVLVLF